MQYKQIYAVALSVVLATAILATGLGQIANTNINQVEAKKPAEKCNNVKIQVKVNGVEEGQEITATATLNGKTVSKTSTVDENETSITIPLNFKKMDPCPKVGDTFSGDVNGTAFNGEIKSLKKPNKVSVTL